MARTKQMPYLSHGTFKREPNEKMDYTVHYKLTLRGTLTEGDMLVKNVPTKHHAITYVTYLMNLDYLQARYEDVRLDLQVTDEYNCITLESFMTQRTEP